MRLKHSVLSLLALFFVFGSLQAGASPLGAISGEDRDSWDSIPRELRDFQRQGFRDGLNGAQRDFESHRRPDVNNRDEFRRPNVPANMAGDYQMGFRRGYDAAVRHFFPGGVPAAMPWEKPAPHYENGSRDTLDYQRIGFNDGLIGAQKDLDSHRRPDINDREEFRNPNIPAGGRGDYQEGYRRGYEEGIHRSYPNGLPMDAYSSQPASPWLAIPRESAQMQKVGYLDGILAAGQDIDAGLAPSLDSHEEYRSSKLSFLVRVLFKAGYKTGYELAAHNFADGIEGVSRPWQRRGFLDGVAAIRQDYDAKRRPDMHIHPEFNNPPVQPNAQDEYRAAYRGGFDMAASYLY